MIYNILYPLKKNNHFFIVLCCHIFSVFRSKQIGNFYLDLERETPPMMSSVPAHIIMDYYKTTFELLLQYFGAQG